MHSVVTRVFRCRPLVFIVALGLLAPASRAGEAETPAKAADTKPDPKTDEATKKMLSDVNYRLELADTHLKYGANEKAEEVLREAIKIGGASAQTAVLRAHFMLGTALQKQEKWAEAAKEYESLRPQLQQPNDLVNVGVLLSQVYDRLKDFTKAEDALLRLTGGKTNLAVRMDGWRALIAFWKEHPQQLDQTIKNSEAAAEKDPKDSDALERLAEIYTDIKPDTKKADVYMTRLIDLGSKEVDGRLRLAALYERQKQYDKAIKLYEGLIPDTSKAGGWELQVRIAVLTVAAGRKDEAVAMVEKNLVPKAQTALETIGLAGFYVNADLPQKAEDAFVKAASLSQSPEDVSTCMLSAADSCRKRKEYAKAEQYVRALLKQYRDNRQVKTQANAALVKLYDEQGRLGDLNLDN